MDALAPPAARLFLVDDDPHVLAALKFAFEAEGRHVVTLASGEALLRERPRPSDCIVIDQRLPGLSGLESITRLRASGVGAPAILVTTHPSRAVREQARALGVDIVEKPLIGDILSKRIAELAQS